MTFHDISIEQSLNILGSNKNSGLTSIQVENSKVKYGVNSITKTKKLSLFARIFNALKEPMLIILMFAFMLTLGTNLGKFLKTGEGDFTECFGVLFTVILSVSITIIMEGNSEKAFNTLKNIYDNITVKVLRQGVIVSLPVSHIVVGDIVILESGDKIVADGRLIESNNLSIDESALTGESNSVNKNCLEVLSLSTPLAERKNLVYSGTFVTNGSGKMLVTAIGNKTEIGGIAGELGKEEQNTPLQDKLGRLGKTITAIGLISAVIVFVVSLIRLILINALTFTSVQELFVSSIVLIVAAVPEGLPTIVAISLALNMVKLAKQNALIKKMSATETAGAVSVICSDKTGTLTENKMKVEKVCKNNFCLNPSKLSDIVLHQNFVCNSTADLIINHKKITYRGSATECALLRAYQESVPKVNYTVLRKNYSILDRVEFNSQNKFMQTTIDLGSNYRTLLKGAPEVVLEKCDLTYKQVEKIISEIKQYQKKCKRVLCFAHKDSDSGSDKFVYDGFVSIADSIRKEVYKAVSDCKKAKIKIKILTGDNFETAFAVAKELNIAKNENEVILASELDKLSDKDFLNAINKVSVIARSTPIIKLRVVKALKSQGEVVAVTGDGINDAPAIKQADVGFAMGINGSDITKESADIVLLDDSFSSVVKSISFGRKVYKNIQRFILFQLSVNLSALFFIVLCAVLGLPAPFNTLQLLWINLIMDGPPALTLGLDIASDDLMTQKPTKRKENIVSKSMLFRILFNATVVGSIMILEYLYDFLNVGDNELGGVIFTLFILFQLFNAFNSIELGKKSIFSRIGKNKLMLFTFTLVILVHFIIVQFCPLIFGVNSLSLLSWVKCIITSSLIIIISEIGKLVLRKINIVKHK